MELNNNFMRTDEKIAFGLRKLYKRYGYVQFKMNKFEEYDFYARNKEFLVSDGIITFNDTNGKLLALKPDVTLSIIKNHTENKDIKKVFYNENVYRISPDTHSFKEIMQTGLECIGNLDIYNICEVIVIAAKSLEQISSEFVLDISHMGLISEILNETGISAGKKSEILKHIAEKNIHDVKKICADINLSNDAAESIVTLISLCGEPDKVISEIDNIPLKDKCANQISELKELISVISAFPWKNKVRFDFSIVNDMNYYNGIVFKGYINGIPTDVLSGGQYDALMSKMGKNCGAVGFAVYLDLFERYESIENDYDVDVLLVYDEASTSVGVMRNVELLSGDGRTVLAVKAIPDNLKYRDIVYVKEDVICE